MAYFLERVVDGRALLTTLSSRRLRIGRGTNNGLRFRDPSVDLEHALIEEVEGGYRLTDLGSVTGTYVNGEKVESAELRAGDEIGIGGFRLVVQVLEPGDPLFLHVESAEEETTTTGALSSGVFRTVIAPADDLVGRAERWQREQAPAAAEAPPEPIDTRPFPTRPAPERRSPHPDARPAVETAKTTTTTKTTATTNTATTNTATRPMVPKARPGPPAAPRHDYARSYRLRLGKAWLAAALSLAVAGVLYGAVREGAYGVFSPGRLSSEHPEKIGDDCGSCHRPFQPIGDRGCQAAGCHAQVGEHQPGLAAAPPSCLECHTEHRGLEALLLAGDGRCAACHGALDERGGALSRFETRITSFAGGGHPEFAVDVPGEDGAPRRVRLSEPRELLGDDRGVSFHHAWHLKLKPRGREPLECASCHTAGDDGLMLPVVFEQHCQGCHNLLFDGRLAGEQAPHDEPVEVLKDLIGSYVLHPEVLDRLRGEERRRLFGRGLSRQQQLAEVARLNAEQLVRDKCTKCHDLAGGRPGVVPLQRVSVEEVRLRERWLPHALFVHGPHLEVMACLDCHGGATESNAARDVLLPGIEVCQRCHRPAEPGEDAQAAHLGGHDCLECHSYHPEPEEARARRELSDAREEDRNVPLS